MNTVNTVHLIGHLGAAPELKKTENGTSVSTFSLATSDRWKDTNGEVQEKTQWHRITAWGKLAEICSEFLNKGSFVYITGSINYSSFEGENGETQYRTDIRAETMKMLDKKPS
ncbi:MAG: single-stranded DNA-binding protein [Balneolaceae bacterium]|nr:single-stranded DNA-binding protein [Balneolaceae bacterium]